jgi:hypothetical protein
MANVAREISGALHPDRLRLIAGDIDNFEFTRLNDKELRIAIARVKQSLSGAKYFRVGAGVTSELPDLFLRQLWERHSV